jgi:hypothetical protein
MSPDEVFAFVAERFPEPPPADQPPAVFQFAVGGMIGALVKEEAITVEDSRQAVNALKPIEANEEVIKRIWGNA